MLVLPGCKINLGLYVTERRSDGYHNLETCFYAVPWHDMLEAVPADQYSLDVSGIELPPGGDNLCSKAFRLLQERYGIRPVKAHLHKCLPHGAGLGGGSSDGASMLLLLNQLYQLNIQTKELEELAGMLGSDCPFFINPIPTLATGRGEIFSPLNLSLNGKQILIVKPQASISTAEAYRHVEFYAPPVPIRDVLENLPIHQWKERLFNAFEQHAFIQIPQLAEIKNLLYELGATFALMSGSGSAIFGLSDQPLPIDQFSKYGQVWQGQLD